LWRKVDWENGLNISEMNEQIRCPWPDDPLYREYHDREWGVPVIDDRELFEFLILEGAQAGLSWITVLRKREAYRRAFSGFDPLQVAVYDAKRTAQLLGDSGLIRNRRKIAAAVTNARAFLEVQSEFNTFATYLWRFVDGRPQQNHWCTVREIPTLTTKSLMLSRDLKRRGFSFVGPTICYAYMQAVGLVNDHLVTCFRHAEVADLSKIEL
jgi:DNA-3-methyladenine glycosylase I